MNVEIFLAHISVIKNIVNSVQLCVYAVRMVLVKSSKFLLFNRNKIMYEKQLNQIIPAMEKENLEFYHIHIKSNKGWLSIAKAVNQGIDSYLTAIDTKRSTFDNTTGLCQVHKEDLVILVRRMLDDFGDDENEIDENCGYCLASDILSTLDIWIE